MSSSEIITLLLVLHSSGFKHLKSLPDCQQTSACEVGGIDSKS
jgi:hypothetical protein